MDNQADESAANVVPKIRPWERLDRAAPCRQQEDIELLSVGNRAGYVCPHQPPGGPGEQQPGEDADGEDGQSEANSEAGRPRVTVTRGGKRKQANAGVLKEYMARLRSLVEDYMGQKVCGEHHWLLYTYGSRAPRVAIYLRIECMACQHAAASPPRDRLWRGKEADRMANHLMMVVVWKMVVKEFEAVKFVVWKFKSISAPLSLTVDSETEDRSYYTAK